MHWPHFDLAGILLDIKEDIGHMRGQLSANTQRLDRIEEKVHRSREPMRLTDLMPALWGAAVLIAAASGRIEWASVAGLLLPGR